MRIIIRYGIWIIAFTCLFGCKEERVLKLESYVFKNQNIDTLAYYSKYNIYSIRVRDYGYLGDFKSEYLFVGKQDSIGYKVNPENLDIELSSQYLALVNTGEDSVGWFNVKNHQVTSSIPKIDSISMILEKKYLDKIVHENNGFFTIYDNGKLLKKLDLGCFLINCDSINYDELEFGIYQVQNGMMKKVNIDGTKLLDQNDGVYFVPSPGYKVQAFGKLIDILSEIKRVNKAKPRKIEIKLLTTF